MEGRALRLSGWARSLFRPQPESPTDTQAGRVWGPGSSEGAGAAATKASSTPGPRTPPPGPPPPSPALLPVALQQALGEAPCGQALGAGLGAVLLLAVLKVLDNVPHVAGLDWKRGDNEGRPPPAGSALQPRPRTGTEAPGTRVSGCGPLPAPAALHRARRSLVPAPLRLLLPVRKAGGLRSASPVPGPFGSHALCYDSSARKL